jgi:hypothetical protein
MKLIVFGVFMSLGLIQATQHAHADCFLAGTRTLAAYCWTDEGGNCFIDSENLNQQCLNSSPGYAQFGGVSYDCYGWAPVCQIIYTCNYMAASDGSTCSGG